jgi:hypothetical protein
MDEENLIKNADLAWCIDVLERINTILKKPDLDKMDIQQIHWLVKQGLKVVKED